jgi:hypothetical protein
MKIFLVHLTSFLFILVSFEFNSSAQNELTKSQLNYDTVESLPFPDIDLHYPSVKKSKINLVVVFHPEFTDRPIDYQNNIT